MQFRVKRRETINLGYEYMVIITWWLWVLLSN